MNQCDGCNRGLPNVNGVHSGPGGFWAGDVQVCTRDMYGFCRYCGAGIPPRLGEGTCPKCDPEGIKKNKEVLDGTTPHIHTGHSD